MKTVIKKILRVGSRSSSLAVVQVKEVFSLLAKAGKNVKYDLATFETKGDIDKTSSLLTNPADNFFSDSLDEALLCGKIDVAIHSAKDLPKNLPSGLKIFALTKSLDQTDAWVGKVKPSQLPIASKVGTSSLLRKAQMLALNPHVEIVDIRGTVTERLKLLDQGKLDALIVASCALKRLGLQKRIKEILPWQGTPLQGQLAVVGREGDKDNEKIFSKIDERRKYGRVFLVGAGPGDPELMTLKGVQILKSADVVFYDYLVHKNILDHALFAQKVSVGKRKGQATLPQSELSVLLKDAAMQGKTVVRLKGGDPLIFGRGADEISYLRAFHIDVEVVAGVSSATGIASNLGIPLTARGISSSVAFLSAHCEAESPESHTPLDIPSAQTLVFFMGLTKLGEIVASLRQKNWASTTPVAVISKGSRVDEQVVIGELADIQKKVKESSLTPPALILVGKVVDLYLDKNRLSKNILYLGTYPEKYVSLGRLIHFPMITISAAKVKAPRLFIKQVKAADIILLTSRCGVKYFFEFLAERKFRLASLRGKDFVVIGADTHKQLNLYGFCARLVAKDETSVGLFFEMKTALKLKGKKIIFPRSSLSNPYLQKALTKAGAKITQVVVYENTKPPKRELPAEKIDQVIFTSPSTVQNFLADYEVIPKEWSILAKGRPTQQTLRQAGYASVVDFY